MFPGFPVARSRSTSGQDKEEGSSDYLGSFSTERRLIVALAVSAAVVCLPLLALFANGEGYGWVELVSAAGAAVALVSVIALTHLYLSLSSKLVRLHGVHADVKKQNATDTLTGAMSRKRFLSLLEKAIGKHSTNGTVALIVFDIDHFKQINDSLGHPAGDDVLAFCAREAKNAFHNAVVGRLGGDEFAVFIKHDGPISDSYIADTCNRFLASLRQGVVIGHRRHQFSASMGIAMAPADDSNVDVLLSYADMALYQAKRNGRGRWTRFEKKILADIRHERFIERELRAAMLLDQLAVHYQPIVDDNGDLYSLEALARWDHPVQGMISPGDYIGIAEKSNLVHDLGLHVLRHVSRDLAKLPKVAINVNVSARQLALAEFRQDYLEILDAHGVDPSRIILEITESAMLETSTSMVERISALHDAGFRIALDDFGLGYSEFNQLRTLPFDIIKIDKSFVQNIGSDSVTDVFVGAVVQIAQRLDRAVIAEGIETADDRVRASVAGCRLFQGYHYHPPAPRAEIAAIYRREGETRAA